MGWRSRHFVVAAVGTLGDFMPALGVARSLAARGHRVEVIAQEAFRSYAGDPDLTFRGFGEAELFHREIGGPRSWSAHDPTFIMEAVIGPSLLPNYRFIKAAAETGSRPVVIATGHAYGALWAAKRLGLTSVGLISSPAVMQIYQTRLSHETMPPALQTRYAALRAAFRGTGEPDLPAPVYDTARSFAGDYVLEYDYLLEMFPRWFDVGAYKILPHCVPGTFPLESDNAVVAAGQEFAAAGPAPWIIFPGSGGTLNTIHPDFFSLVATACEAGGRRAILIDRNLPVDFRRHSDHIASLRSTDLNALLPLSRGLLHHGGIGSTSLAMAHGRPHVVIPVAYDQPGNAAWLTKHGLGVSAAPDRIDSAGIAALLDAAEALPPAPIAAAAERLLREGGCNGLTEALLSVLMESEAVAARA